jgi:hypothetical protein
LKLFNFVDISGRFAILDLSRYRTVFDGSDAGISFVCKYYIFSHYYRVASTTQISFYFYTEESDSK